MAPKDLEFDSVLSVPGDDLAAAQRFYAERGWLRAETVKTLYMRIAPHLREAFVAMTHENNWDVRKMSWAERVRRMHAGG